MGSPSLHFTGLKKTFGSVVAVDDLTFTVTPGRVTGFLGPNGAGKTTTLQLLLGLLKPTAGTALVGSSEYSELPNPMGVVGSHLSPDSFQPGRSGRGHLEVLAAAGGFPRRHIDLLLDTVGLTRDEDRRVGDYSLGMRQRLGIASALLGDPKVLVLDEPANGLDPEGIRWLRSFLRGFAAQGNTVLLSSHMLSEIQQIAHDVVIIDGGRLVASGSVADLERLEDSEVQVASPQEGALRQALIAAGWQFEEGEIYTVRGTTAEEVGMLALINTIPLTHLSEASTGLESTFLSLVGGKE